MPALSAQPNRELKCIHEFHAVQPGYGHRFSLAGSGRLQQSVGCGAAGQLKIDSREKIGVGVGFHSPAIAWSSFRKNDRDRGFSKSLRRRAENFGSEVITARIGSSALIT